MSSLTGRAAALAGMAVLLSVGSASAQMAEPSLGCRLFPLACPGPVPAPPPPLLGTPEEQAAQEPAPPAPHQAHRHRVSKHVAKHAAKSAAQ